MTASRQARQAARRAAVLAAAGVYSLTGRAAASRAEPGLTTLLLHNTPPPLLQRLTRWVDRHREDIVSFADGVARVERGELDRRLFALSFDDGFLSNLGAARMLRARGVTAVFYVPTDVVGMSKPDSDLFFRRTQAEGVMGWGDLENLVAAGHQVGSHCRQHLPMVDFPDAAAEDQLKGSVEVLRARLGPTRHFAWPFGGLHHVDVDRVVRWSRESGVVPASGVRGRATKERLERSGFLRRDAVDLRWIPADLTAFGVRDSRQLRNR